MVHFSILTWPNLVAMHAVYVTWGGGDVRYKYSVLFASTKTHRDATSWTLPLVFYDWDVPGQGKGLPGYNQFDFFSPMAEADSTYFSLAVLFWSPQEYPAHETISKCGSTSDFYTRVFALAVVVKWSERSFTEAKICHLCCCILLKDPSANHESMHLI